MELKMERIGIAASKMAKGNLALYNFYVVLISLLFSIFMFVISGASVLFALIIISYVGTEVMGIEFERSRSWLMAVCMISLTVVIALLNIFAILKNIKLTKANKES